MLCRIRSKENIVLHYIVKEQLHIFILLNFETLNLKIPMRDYNFAYRKYKEHFYCRTIQNLPINPSITQSNEL